MEILDEIMAGVPEEEVEKMVYGNVRELYDIKLPAQIA